MKIITYSDLHLEFKPDIEALKDALAQSDADVLALSGDCVVMENYKSYELLAKLLEVWSKPVLYVHGNHEYYSQRPMSVSERGFKSWLESSYPNARVLANGAVTIDGVHFFGGTMWTDFSGGNVDAMSVATKLMQDFKLIKNENHIPLKPSDMIALHEAFKLELLLWFKRALPGPHVVISHHAPVHHLHPTHERSLLSSAFVAEDMRSIIEQYQPEVWIYGHTHQCDDQSIGRTRIVSNQLGYVHRQPTAIDVPGRPSFIPSNTANRPMPNL